jgi:hypothetical protein
MENAGIVIEREKWMSKKKKRVGNGPATQYQPD